MKKLALIITLCAAAFAARAEYTVTGVYTNDLAALKTAGVARDWPEVHAIADNMLIYTNSYAVNVAKCRAYGFAKEYESLLALAVEIGNKQGEGYARLKLKQYEAVYSDTGYPVHNRIEAAARGDLIEPAAINAMFAEWLADCGNLSKAPFKKDYFNRYYDRSAATTAEYVELLETMLRVIETNARTQDFKSFIKTELEANR